ncbi:MAG: primosomal protein N' [Hyphomicrobiaceae bacterium]
MLSKSISETGLASGEPLTQFLELTGDPCATRERVPVVVPVAVDQSYDYLLDEDGSIVPGSFVLVPLGPQLRIGVVWDRPYGAQRPVAPEKLKSLAGRVAAPPLPVVAMRFAEWIANYTVSPLGMVLRMMMGARAAFEPEKPRFGVQIVADAQLPARMTPPRVRVIETAADGHVRTKSELARLADCSTGVIDGLVQAGVLVDVVIADRGYPTPDPLHHSTGFSEDQSRVVQSMLAAIEARTYSVTLLDGVTGSGKTEVYFEAVAAALAQGRQVLIMLPEIALTSQFMNRFAARFGCAPVEWHSALSGAERGRIWRAVGDGKARCIVGARSGLFLPYSELGLIVVDEEHDAGFKQEDRVTYQARDMAVVRASLEGFPIVLASATPSIESHVNARTGRYRHTVLPGRFSGVAMPDVRAIDMRSDPPKSGQWLSPTLVAAVQETLKEKRQSLLFLNRRGYAPLTLCRSCGHRIECPQCSAWLVEHRFRRRLNCHHCGFSLPIPEKCPKCSDEGGLVACGPGVERICEEVTERFPDARVVLLSSDLIPTLTEMRAVIADIEAGKADLIIGTQIVAKGHHFPDLATVGIVDGDLGLSQADPRAGERSFQLMHQVTGRAGRALERGRGFVQTHLPEHPVMQAIVAGDRDSFVESEIRSRQRGLLPPFGRLVALIISARQKEMAEGFARAVARAAPASDKVSVLGPTEAPLAVIRGRHRLRLLIKCPREIDVQSYLRQWLGHIPAIKGDVRLQVDVDPYNFL